MHYIGSQEELPVAVLKEQAEVITSRVPAQEMQEAKEQGKELPECVDHQPSSFERGKPRSISLHTVCKSLILLPLCLMH
jgi:hypothetical protein